MISKWQRTLSGYEWLQPHFLRFASVAEIVSYCRAHGITLIAGIKLGSQKFLAEHGAELRAHGLQFIANDKQTSSNCENKHDFKKFMDEHGFGSFVPAYYRRPEEVRYPCIVKPHYGSFGIGQRIVSSPEELGSFPADAVVSEYISGNVEYATHIFFLNRETYLDITYEKTYASPYFILGQEEKNNLCYQKVATEHLALLLDILAALRYRGICCIDYKPSATGPKIFEINARIGYTLASHPHDFKQIFDLYAKHAAGNH